MNGGTCQSWFNNNYNCICPRKFFFSYFFSHFNIVLANYTGKNCGHVIPSDICIRGDLNPKSCHEWRMHGFCDFNFLFQNIPVPLYCPVSCGVCIFPPCLDVDINCPLWQSYGFCNYLNTHHPGLCRRSCNAC